jgi:hypothetical protein
VFLQVQVWDIQQQQDSMRPSMDPILKISEGIEGKVRTAAAAAQSSRRSYGEHTTIAAAELRYMCTPSVCNSNSSGSLELVHLCC